MFWYSNIFTQDDFYCGGTRSCANAIAEGAYDNYLDAHLAAQNAILKSLSYGYTNVYYYFRGWSSGDGASINCQRYRVCHAKCYHNGCNNLVFSNCDGSCHADCTYAQRSDLCPSGYVPFVNISNLLLLSNVTVSLSNYNNSFVACNRTNDENT